MRLNARRRSPGALALLLVLPLVAAGCSFGVDIAVVNVSRSTLTVTYQIRRDLSYLRASWGDPRLGDGALFLRGRVVKWSPPAPVSVARDTLGLRVTVVVPPGYALRVADGTNYTGPDGADGTTFPLASVELSGERGRVTFQGTQTAWAFRRLEQSRYALVYH